MSDSDEAEEKKLSEKEVVFDDEESLMDSSVTDDVTTRWLLTNDVIAISTVASFVTLIAAHGAGMVDLSTLPTEVTWAWIAVVLAAATWALGIDLVEKWGGR